MPRIRQPQRITRIITRNEPLKRSQHIRASGKKRRAAILWRVCQHDHVALVGRESPLANEVLAHVYGIVDAAVQLVAAAEVVDSN